MCITANPQQLALTFGIELPSFHFQEKFMNRGLIGGVLAILVICMIVLGSWYTVDQTERGVRLRNGAVVGTAQPGLGFKIPVIDSVEKVSVKTATYTWDKMNSYSYDQQPADLKISVTLRAAPEKVADLYAKFGRLDAAVNQVVSPVVNQQVKVVFGRYTAVKAIQERGALNSAIKDAITESLKYDPMIIIESVQLENIEFSQNYLHSIEQRMLAEVEVQKLQQNAEREKVQAQITVTQATAKANAVRAEAQANAEAVRLNGEAKASNIRITGEAEAAAIEARAKALGSNPNLVTLVQAERWNGVLPTTMVPGSAVPFVSVK
jgi:regulator of protease activity HflC (stomatin/prohibitin superfamily)